MSLLNFIEQNDKLRTAKIKKEKFIPFNLFELISNKYHRENLHSDILFFILNPQSSHNRGYEFLFSFIDFINKNITSSDLKIDIKNYEEVEVCKEESSISMDTQETGRIDILIKGNGKSIIVENKINNAPDTNNQIPKYVSHLGGINKVDAIVYLSLDGSKRPTDNWQIPPQYSMVDYFNKMIYVAASDNNVHSKKGLAEHFFMPIISSNQKLKDQLVYHLLENYSQLLIKIRNQMNLSTEEENFFYKLENDENFYETAMKIQTLLSKPMSVYYANYYEKKFKPNCQPFTDVFIAGDNQVIFNKWKFEESNYFLQIIFFTEEQEFHIRLIDRNELWNEQENSFFLEKLKQYNFIEEDYCWLNKISFADRKQIETIIPNLLRDFQRISTNNYSEII